MQIKGRVQSKFAVVADVLYEDVVFRAPPSLRAVSLRLMILLCSIIVWRVVWWDKKSVYYKIEGNCGSARAGARPRCRWKAAARAQPFGSVQF